MREDVVPLLQRLVTCDTSNPPGNEAAAAAILEAYLDPFGIELERVAKDPARPNLVARLRGRESGPSVAFLGHLDVVKARREDWSVDPFAGVIRDGAVWGRGTVDMKCQVAATAVALATLAHEGFTPDGDVMVLLMADEEVGEAGVGAPFFVEARPDIRPDFIVGEGAGERYETESGPVYLVDRGVKASASAQVLVHGHPGDASLAGNGRSAIREAARLVERLASTQPTRRVPPEVEPLLAVADGHPELGAVAESLTTNVWRATTIEATGPTNVVPDRAEIGLYGAVLPGEERGDLERELRERLGDGTYELDVEKPEGGRTSGIDTPLFRAIESFVAEHDPDARVVPALGYGYSDCDTFRGAHGSVVYGFIPFRHADPAQNLQTKHGVDERVLVDDLLFQVDCARHVALTVGTT
jgi:acetylornithine deacetylase/succinyl-diaminopimelate desuccinylase-like protein